MCLRGIHKLDKPKLTLAQKLRRNEVKMIISNLFEKKKPVISFEIFPPKKEAELQNIDATLQTLATLHPDFISVTYGAGGSTTKKTVEVASHIQNGQGTTALAHLTCIDSTKEQVKSQLARLREQGIENIMALRGDKPKNFTETSSYAHAIDLVTEIRSAGGFCVGGACYPEGHMECPHKAEDIGYLREKVNAGCDFLTTQMFFDNNILYNFLYRIREKGITIPVLPGIMPITNAKQMKRTLELSGTVLPQRFVAILDRFGEDPEAMKQAGIAYATDQIIDLIANGINHVHVYSMNKPEVAAAIMSNLSSIVKTEA